MRLTRGSDYGLRGVLHLARQPMGKVLLVSEVARAEDVPESYLAKIFQDLSRTGLIISHRGAKGGFSLAKPSSEIAMKEVIEAIEGLIALSPCLDPRQGCERMKKCAVHLALAQAQAELLAVLEETSIQSLAERAITLAD
ncbi:MAG: RrF2 family transcriptional regulator [Anaerolineae bacterium]